MVEKEARGTEVTTTLFWKEARGEGSRRMKVVGVVGT
jgi:hypothetical protein